MAYALGFNIENYDYVGDAYNITLKEDCAVPHFFNIADSWASTLPNDILQIFGALIVALAGQISVFAIRVPKTLMFIALLIVHILFSVPNFFVLMNRNGSDFHAYLNQAG